MGRRVFCFLLALLIPLVAVAQEYPPGQEPKKIDPLDVIREIGAADLRHGAAVTALDFHPEGKLLVAGSADGVLRVWDVETGNCRILLRDEGPCVRDVRFTDRGGWVRAASCERMRCGKRFHLQRFEVTTGRIESSRVGGFLHTRHATLSPNGKHAVVGIGTYGYPKVYDPKTWGRKDWEEVGVFGVDDKSEHKRQVGPAGHSLDDRPEITRVAVADGGLVFAAVRGNGKLRIFRIGEKREERDLSLGESPVVDLTFDRGGTRLVVAQAEGRVRVVSVETGKDFADVRLDGTTLTTARIGRDTARIVAGAEDGAVTLLDLTTGAARWRTDLGASPVRVVAVSHDGKLVAAGTGDGKIHLLRFADGREVTPAAARRAGFADFAFLREGKRFVAAEGEEIVTFESGTGKELERRNAGLGALGRLTPLPDGLIVTGAAGTVALDPEGHARWRTDLGGMPDGPLLFDPNGRWILVKLEKKDLVLLSRATGKVLLRIEVPDEYGGAAAFARDGKTFRWTDGARLMTFDGETGEHLSDLEIHKYRGRATFDASGERVLRLHYTSKVTVHECATGGVLRTIPVQRTLAGFTGLVASPDGKWVLTGSGPRWVHIAGFMGTSNLHLSKIGKAEYGRGLEAGGFWTHQLGFGPNTRFAWGVTLPKASHEETLRIFRMPDGKLLGGLTGPALRFAEVRISPTGLRAVASTADGRLFLLRLPPPPKKK